MDPLALLRDYVRQGALTSVELRPDSVTFGGNVYTFPRKAETSYRALQGKGDDYLALDAVVFLLQNKSAKHTSYMADARRNQAR